MSQKLDSKIAVIGIDIGRSKREAACLGGVDGGSYLFMMKPSISLSRPGSQILAVCAETRVSKISHCQPDQRAPG